MLWPSPAMLCGVGEGVEMAGGVLRGGLWAVCFEAQLLMCISVSAGGVCRPPPGPADPGAGVMAYGLVAEDSLCLVLLSCPGKVS